MPGPLPLGDPGGGDSTRLSAPQPSLGESPEAPSLLLLVDYSL